MTKSLTFVLSFQVSLQSQKLHVKLYTYSIKVRLRGDTVLIYIPSALRMRFHTSNKNFQVPGILLRIEFKLGGFIFMTCYTFTFHFINTYLQKC